MCKIWVILFLCIAANVRTCGGSAWLQDPPSRSAAWYYQIKTPVNYNFRNLDCGGVPVRINADGSRNCGLCGDPYTDPTPRDNEFGGKYADPRVRSRYFESGQVAEISLWNNLPGAPGFYEFRLCDEDSNQTQACLDKHLLTIRDTGTTYMPVPKTQGLVMVHVELPAGVTCDYCLLQWRFRKESLAGCDDTNWCGVGRGAQIEYYNCADVMIGSVGQPKPSFIKDPIYTASDYGSAYDVATTRTDQPDGSNLGGSTTTQAITTTTATTTTTKGVPIFTIPTGFPGTTTTDNPVTTSQGTTVNPFTTTTGTAPKPEDSRLVVDSNGNAVSGQNTFGGNSKNNNLLILLTLLPFFGAIGLQNSRSGGAVQPFPVPPNAPVTWAQALPLYPIQFDNTFGFGNFRTGSPAYAVSGSYGSKIAGGTYNTKTGYNAGYSILSPGQKNYGLAGGNIKPLVNTGPLNQLQTNYQNRKIYPSNNIIRDSGFLNKGGAQFVQNPVVWRNNGITVNNGFTSHVFPRSTNFQSGTPYQPSPNQYSQPSSVAVHSPPLNNGYSSSHQSGYAPNNNIKPPNPGMPVRSNAVWPRNQVQEVNSRQSVGPGQGIRNLQDKVAKTVNNNWQNNNGIGSRFVGSGQILPVPETVTQRMRLITPVASIPDNSFNLPGIESASRFRLNGPRQIIETSQPMKNIIGAVKQNGGPINGAFTRAPTLRNRIDSRDMKSGGSFLVNDWYNMLINRFPGTASRTM